MLKIQLKQINELEREELDKVITPEEIIEVISSVQGGKAPRPDGFTHKFYRTFQKELFPKFQILSNNILEGEGLPKIWHEAMI